MAHAPGQLRLAVLLGVLAASQQATTGCKNCITLGKEEKAMFRVHSEGCFPQSQAEPRQVEQLLGGELVDAPPLRRHVYCMLLKCKLIGKDGKLHKTAVLAKMAARPDAKNATKVLESCADQTGDSPEDLAWNLFRCGYDKKALLFAYMPTGAGGGAGGDADADNNS